MADMSVPQHCAVCGRTNGVFWVYHHNINDKMEVLRKCEYWKCYDVPHHDFDPWNPKNKTYNTIIFKDT